jgi:hypothetical protein
MRLTAFWSEFNHHNAKQTPFVYHFVALTEPEVSLPCLRKPFFGTCTVAYVYLCTNYPVRIRFFPILVAANRHNTHALYQVPLVYHLLMMSE